VKDRQDKPNISRDEIHVVVNTSSEQKSLPIEEQVDDRQYKEAMDQANQSLP
jgi:hypothetical protein